MLDLVKLLNITMSKVQSAFYVFTHLILSSEIGKDYYPHFADEETEAQRVK